MLSGAPNLFVDIWVDHMLCIKSRCCIDECSMGVFDVIDDVTRPVREEICVACFKCLEFCPAHAIAIRWVLRVA
jgi:NAD-dependent dihydropyrimidine dehydrogenase PreA subunit